MVDWKSKKLGEFKMINHILGRGSFGTVYLGKMKESPESEKEIDIAVKCIDKK
jgi:hypothetical protein